jgi:hypothetical protein
MGSFIDGLPVWASMTGYDKLEAVEPRRKANGGVYTPGKGTTVEAVLKTLHHNKLRPFDLMAKLAKTHHNKKGVNSALFNLVERGLVTKYADGTYGAKG